MKPPIIVSDAAFFRHAALSAQAWGCPFNQLMVHRAPGASERNSLSSCGTNSDGLMPCCHCQFIQTVMMFPNKYFTLYLCIQDSQCLSRRGNLCFITLKTLQAKTQWEEVFWVALAQGYAPNTLQCSSISLPGWPHLFVLTYEVKVCPHEGVSDCKDN